jgi:signal transduction histidine kinase
MDAEKGLRERLLPRRRALQAPGGGAGRQAGEVGRHGGPIMNLLGVLRAPRLAAHASHEVRGPLTVALLALEGMVARGELPADAALGLELQLRRARLGVDDLDAAARGGRAPDRLEPVAVPALLAQVGLAWRPVAQARGSALEITGCDGAVLADRERLAQALGNLIANALEHGGAPVEIRARRVGDRLRLEVHDCGPGLAEPLRTLSRRPRGRRGHGLAIAAGIAGRHGGRLLAAPSSSGATLVLELPLRDLAELAQHPASPPEGVAP